MLILKYHDSNLFIGGHEQHPKAAIIFVVYFHVIFFSVFLQQSVFTFDCVRTCGGWIFFSVFFYECDEVTVGIIWKLIRTLLSQLLLVLLLATWFGGFFVVCFVVINSTGFFFFGMIKMQLFVSPVVNQPASQSPFDCFWTYTNVWKLKQNH